VKKYVSKQCKIPENVVKERSAIEHASWHCTVQHYRDGLVPKLYLSYEAMLVDATESVLSLVAFTNSVVDRESVEKAVEVNLPIHNSDSTDTDVKCYR